MLEMRSVSKSYRTLGRPAVDVLQDVSLAVGANASVGLVGESGSGKSTLLRCIMRLEKIDSGSIRFDGEDVPSLRGTALREYRRRVQMVFQDPIGSLSPRLSVSEIIQEGMLVHKRGMSSAARGARVGELLEMVGLDPDDRSRVPGSFSGGQRQRIAIARALAVEPDVLVCDEPVSALDVSVQAQVLNVLLDMRRELGLSLLFVAHDLAVVRYVCDDISVLRSGVIVEHSDRRELFEAPRVEYTRELIAAVPGGDAIRTPSYYRRPPTDLLAAHPQLETQ
jgi:ABC-type glutathione transport system ATPase component